MLEQELENEMKYMEMIKIYRYLFNLFQYFMAYERNLVEATQSFQ